jgi:hypothetical protein
MDYTFATRHPHIKFSNDATSCFDRIIPSVSSIVARSYGLHRNIAQLHGNMLLHAVYRIKIQLCISDDYYSHSDEFQVFGTGQGSSSSPSIWTLYCSKGFDIYDAYCHGAHYTTPDCNKNLKLGMTGFVDDNNAQTTGHPAETEEALAQRCTHDAQLWHDILWATGGALETSKCSYQSMCFDFSGSGTPFLRHGTHGPLLSSKTQTVLISLYTKSQSPTLTKFWVLTRWPSLDSANNKQFYSKRHKITVVPSHSVMSLSKAPGYITHLYFSEVLATPSAFAT